MGRTREFDLEEAIHLATDLFWRQGYDATSVGALTDAMQITPPSFYFAFKSKEALFRLVVERYVQQQCRIVDESLRCATRAETIDALIRGFAELFSDRKHAPGCLILNSALPVTDSHPFRKWFSDQRNALRRRLCDRLLRATPEDPHPMNRTDAESLARLLVVIVWGMAVEAQSGASRQALRGVAATFATIQPNIRMR
jgi:AcrR family transcriptional regulator